MAILGVGDLNDPLLIATYGQADPATFGGKAAALAALTRTGLGIPAWVVVPTEAADADLCWTDRYERALGAALNQLGINSGLFAVRSSAADEDGVDHSFAGQLESFLAVPRAQIGQRVVDVWRSADAENLRAYRQERGLDAIPNRPAVLIQRFIESESAGVAFAADPVTGQRGVAVVSAAPGLGTALVGGDVDADTWRIDRNGTLLETKIAIKTQKHLADPASPNGTSVQPIPNEDAEKPTLTESQACAVAELARRTSDHFGRPQDIEWAFDANGTLHLLQSRPITSLRGRADPDAAPTVWDNANIAESYSGVTTAMTFSFARHAYHGVYRQFCLILRVPRKKVDANDRTLATMLGLVRGRVYYNLASWYRLLSLLPGFSVNRAYMEQMMGLREPLPASMLAAYEPAGRGQRWADGLRLTRGVAALVYEHLRLNRSIRAFYARLNDALESPAVPLERQRLDEFADTYRALEAALIRRWDAPLINDFLAMIFFGVLRSLCGKWANDPNGQLHNHLLCAQGGIISAEPAKRIAAMAQRARPHPDLVEVLCAGPTEHVLDALHEHDELRRDFDDYLDRFGDRCLEELKLESLTLRDDPTPLLRSVGFAARRQAPAGSADAEVGMRREAEARVKESLRGRPLRRLLFGWVLRNARGRVRDRENLRFERTRLFGRVRAIVVQMGHRLAEQGVLNTPRDVFDLELDEVLGFADGTGASYDLRGIARARHAEFSEYQETDAPADRAMTYGPWPFGNDLSVSPKALHPSDAERAADESTLRGVGACPGVVRGQVRCIRDPRAIELAPGTIVVAERTDPGWIMLFPAAAGVLVEHGSLLSHSAIVARELGVPCVVSIPSLMSTLRDGETVEMDGQAGTVRRGGDDLSASGATP
ncbi:MAG: PEP/pyruvate-binding domain-containing protein [Planctomycetota bacterium]